FLRPLCLFFVFFFNDSATTEIYTLSLHDALPIFLPLHSVGPPGPLLNSAVPFLSLQATSRSRFAFSPIFPFPFTAELSDLKNLKDRKSTRLNSSHVSISYAVFCLKKKKRLHTSM